MIYLEDRDFVSKVISVTLIGVLSKYRSSYLNCSPIVTKSHDPLSMLSGLRISVHLGSIIYSNPGTGVAWKFMGDPKAYTRN